MATQAHYSCSNGSQATKYHSRIFLLNIFPALLSLFTFIQSIEVTTEYIPCFVCLLLLFATQAQQEFTSVQSVVLFVCLLQLLASMLCLLSGGCFAYQTQPTANSLCRSAPPHFFNSQQPLSLRFARSISRQGKRPTPIETTGICLYELPIPKRSLLDVCLPLGVLMKETNR